MVKGLEACIPTGYDHGLVMSIESKDAGASSALCILRPNRRSKEFLRWDHWIRHAPNHPLSVIVQLPMRIRCDLLLEPLTRLESNLRFQSVV